MAKKIKVLEEKLLRERIGISQAVIAYMTGVTSATIARWEQGRPGNAKLKENWRTILKRLDTQKERV